MNDLLQLRKTLKSKKPKFLRQDATKIDEVRKRNWKQPKGIHSAMRNKKKGYRKQPSMGYGSPRKVRGLSPTGLIPIRVFNLNDLEKVTKNHAVIIGGSVGAKKRIEILKQVKTRGLSLLQVKKIDDLIKRIETNVKAKKEVKLTKKKQKLAIKKEAPKKEEKQKTESVKTEEEKTEELKKQKQKVLEKGL